MQALRARGGTLGLGLNQLGVFLRVVHAQAEALSRTLLRLCLLIGHLRAVYLFGGCPLPDGGRNALRWLDGRGHVLGRALGHRVLRGSITLGQVLVRGGLATGLRTVGGRLRGTGRNRRTVHRDGALRGTRLRSLRGGRRTRGRNRGREAGMTAQHAARLLGVLRQSVQHGTRGNRLSAHGVANPAAAAQVEYAPQHKNGH